MNLAKKYKQLFEGKGRSNDSTLLKEEYRKPSESLHVLYNFLSLKGGWQKKQVVDWIADWKQTYGYEVGHDRNKDLAELEKNNELRTAIDAAIYDQYGAPKSSDIKNPKVKVVSDKIYDYVDEDSLEILDRYIDDAGLGKTYEKHLDGRKLSSSEEGALIATMQDALGEFE